MEFWFPLISMCILANLGFYEFSFQRNTNSAGILLVLAFACLWYLTKEV